MGGVGAIFFSFWRKERIFSLISKPPNHIILIYSGKTVIYYLLMKTCIFPHVYTDVINSGKSSKGGGLAFYFYSSQSFIP